MEGEFAKMDIAIRDGRMYNWCVKISGNKSNPLYRNCPKNAMFLRKKYCTKKIQEVAAMTKDAMIKEIVLMLKKANYGMVVLVYNFVTGAVSAMK